MKLYRVCVGVRGPENNGRGETCQFFVISSTPSAALVAVEEHIGPSNITYADVLPEADVVYGDVDRTGLIAGKSNEEGR